jgi:acetyltransferase-like isoleucine patch superfamily enzyme
MKVQPQTQQASLSDVGGVSRPLQRLGRLLQLLRFDLTSLRPRLLIANFLISFLPRLTFGWLRPALYRMAGVRIGSRTRIYGKLELEGVGDVAANLRVGERCMFTTPLYLNLSAPISIGDRVVIGHHVVIITDDHRMEDPTYRGGKRFSVPVTIEDGAWIAARVTVLPGVTIGRGSVVAASAIVTKDIPPNTLVAGVPARILKELPT